MDNHGSDLRVIADGVFSGRITWAIHAGRHGEKFSTFVEMTDTSSGRSEMMGFRGPLFYDNAGPNTFFGSASDLPSVFMARCSPDVISARLTCRGASEELVIYRSTSYPEAVFLLAFFEPGSEKPGSLVVEYRLSGGS